MKKFAVYVVSDDPHCCAKMTFKAKTARLQDAYHLLVDGIMFENWDGFFNLEEVK